ncbi:MAG: SLC13 family permease [Solirubrobacteraceae bacterium]
MALLAALEQCWPPFALVAGLLLVGLVAGNDGLFAAAASRLERLPGPPIVLFAASCGLVAVTTALLNLDTAAVFLTPVLIEAARRRGTSELPFLYAALFMVNASSLYLPGSNLTNLLVLSSRHASGGAFFVKMLPAALAATLLSAAGLVVIHRRRLRGSQASVTGDGPELELGAGLVSVVAAAALMIVLADAALPVLGVGVLAALLRLVQRRVTASEVLARLGVPVLLGLFALAVALGTLARATGFPGAAVRTLPAPATAAVSAVATVLVNNLPAAVLLSARAPAHPTALLIGLDVGPNLALSGSLSALLWWRAAVGAGARPSASAFSRQGILLAPLAIAAAVAVSVAFGS